MAIKMNISEAEIIAEFKRIAEITGNSVRQIDWHKHSNLCSTALLSTHNTWRNRSLTEWRKLAGLPEPTKAQRKPKTYRKHGVQRTQHKKHQCQCGNWFDTPVDSKGSALNRFCPTCKNTEAWIDTGRIDDTRYTVNL
jgi:hypothetical protein